jgi:hypothetical protein
MKVTYLWRFGLLNLTDPNITPHRPWYPLVLLSSFDKVSRITFQYSDFRSSDIFQFKLLSNVVIPNNNIS